MQLRTGCQVFAVIGLLSFALSAPPRASAKTMNITGCLQKGDEANEYKIMENGKSYGLYASDGVNLSEHVGHEVTVTGTTTGERKETAAEEKNEKMAGAKEESMHLNVTAVKHISDTCTAK